MLEKKYVYIQLCILEKIFLKKKMFVLDYLKKNIYVHMINLILEYMYMLLKILYVVK